MIKVAKRMRCPKCGSDDIVSHGKRYAVYPVGCLMLFAFPIAWMHWQSTPHDFECAACGRPFALRSKAAKIAHVALWAGLLILIAWIVRAAARA